MARAPFLALGVTLLMLGSLAYLALTELMFWSQDIFLYGVARWSSLLGARIEGIAGLVVVAVLAAPAAGLIIKRLHDIGWSGWWLAPIAAPEIVNSLALMSGAAGTTLQPTGLGEVLAVAAVVGAVALLPVALWPGTKGPNRFGPEPTA
jgi:uncharacterized membrane protein YhaH (DUF805 family)